MDYKLTSSKTWRTLLRKSIPVLFALLGLWLLAGCFVIPVWPKRDNPKEYDFRSEIGDGQSSKPVRPGAISRQKIIERFGAPSYSRGQSMEYGLTLTESVRVWPLCFRANIAHQRIYRLSLHFDKDDILEKYELIGSDKYDNPLGDMIQ